MFLQQIVSTLLIAASAIVLVTAQNGPYPPRLSIPGAVPVPPSRPVVRVRRPIALRQHNPLPAVSQRIIEESKPVNESPEDEGPDVYLPTLLREQQQSQFQQAAAAFLNNEPNSIGDTSYVQLLHHEEPTPTAAPPTRFVERPSISQSRPAFSDYGIGTGIVSSQRFGLERVQTTPQAPEQPTAPLRSNIIRSRPALREQRPQYEQQSVPVQAPVPAPAPQRPRPKPIQSRPIIEQNQLQDERDPNNRRQRPVAQTIRKWREENEDGSITWGYENDDGSFKEELIGTDCVTKGTYGYIDPDGNKREYHYETGNRCDPNAREPEEEIEDNSFVNYEENRAVLPNGLQIDMSQLGKKKSKRPANNYRN